LSEGAALPARDGLAARRLAVAVLEDVLKRRRPLDERMDRLAGEAGFQALSPGDRGLVRAIALSALRGHGIVAGALAARMPSGMPPASGSLAAVLVAATSQILFLEVADHAAVDTAVDLAREDRHARHFAGLANAVLRRIARERAEIVTTAEPLAGNTPRWLADSWRNAYGEETALAIARAHLAEPPLDLTVRSDAAGWAERLGARLLPTGSLRLDSRQPVPLLPGFADGAWWVQDAAAALPARLLCARPGERVLDLCAAPGGKTAQLAAAGATVTALDRSEPRIARLSENLDRLGLAAEVVVADAATFSADPFDAVLVDAPCSATGTLRRQPDVAVLRTLEDLHKLVALQARILANAARLVRPGGRLVYAVCSLEPAEGERQVARFLSDHPAFVRSPVTADEIGGQQELLTADGDLRTLPCHWPDERPRMAGLDGFFAARLVRAT
jgi:16S rRNA (cytosine967-C5)-methyltransferase